MLHSAPDLNQLKNTCLHLHDPRSMLFNQATQDEPHSPVKRSPTPPSQLACKKSDFLNKLSKIGLIRLFGDPGTQELAHVGTWFECDAIETSGVVAPTLLGGAVTPVGVSISSPSLRITMVQLPANRRDQLRSATHVARIRDVILHVLVVFVERPFALSDEAAQTRGEHAASAAENSAAIHHPKMRAANGANIFQRLPQSRFGLVRFWLTHLGVGEAGPAPRKLRMHNLANTIHVAS